MMGDAESTDALAARFHSAMIDVYTTAKTEADYNATYFIQMVDRLGGVEAARRLINDPTPASGFTHLWERGRLDITVEATVLRREFASLFSSMELRRARQRLEDYGYTPD